MLFGRSELSIAVALAIGSMAAGAGAAEQTSQDAQAQQTPVSQDSPGAAADKSVRRDQIQSVIVTAQKRKENVDKVPVSISVVTADDLSNQHINGLEDITRSVPNISFSGGSQGNGPGLSNIEMRGISSAAGSGTVGMYMDDVSMTTRNLYSLGTAEPKFFDVDRIEVLRGPQGTLYGASSMGGTLKVITNQPDLKHTSNSGMVEVSHTDHGGMNTTANAVLNLPLVPNRLALRIGVQGSHDDGYITQVDPVTLAPLHTRTNSERDGVLRLGLKWMVDQDLTITPSIFYQTVKTGDLPTEYPNSQITNVPLQPYQISKPNLEPGTDKLFVPSLNVNYDFGPASLVSVSSYYQRKFDRVQDGTQANSAYLATLLGPDAPAELGNKLGVLPAFVYLNNQVRQFSQEFRLTSRAYDPRASSPWTWLGGAYFSNLHTTVNDFEPVPGLNALFNSYGLNADDPNALSGSFPGAFAQDSAYFSARHYRDTQKALFGEVNYHFTPALTATAGLRALSATDSLGREGSGYFTSQPGMTVQLPHDVDAHAYTPKFALSWDSAPNNMVYADAAKGFRLGSQNREIPLSLCGAELASMGLAAAPASYSPDSLWSYEIGDKARLLDNHLAINASAFYIDWKNIQVDRQLNCTFDYETNAGRARSSGIEFEAKFKPNRDWTFDLGTGYTNAYLVEANQALGSLAGQKVPGVPKFNATLSSEYDFTVNSATDGFARLTGHWTGSSYGTPHIGDSDYLRPAYATVDASVGLKFENWQVSLFAKNLGNNDKVIQTPSVQYFTERYRLVPRTVGVNLSGSL